MPKKFQNGCTKIKLQLKRNVKKGNLFTVYQADITLNRGKSDRVRQIYVSKLVVK